MNEPIQPAEPGTDNGVSPAHNPTGTTPDGVPVGTGEHEPMGWPTSDRAKTETAGKP